MTDNKYQISETKGQLLGIADSALAKIAASGALGAVSVNKSQTDELTLESGEFSLLRTTYNSSLSLRALIPEGERGNRKGSYSTNSLDASAVETAVGAAIAAARSSEPDTAEIIAPGFGERDFEADYVPLDLDKLYTNITEFLADAARDFPKVKILQLIAKYNSGASLLANSNGTRGFITYGYYSLSIEYSGRDGDNTTGFGYTG
ncbi:MAG: hypothetical protein LBM98_05040, partial [Oscillospiraceae bacterium]|nr:hypothetical protein [Oscillospiraceae bacterium]